MSKVYLGLGSNLGDKIGNLKNAVGFFIWDNRFENVKISPFYSTRPYGNEDQDNFINGVISFDTNIAVDVLLNLIKELERRVGRKKKGDWGPREIDIDILLYGDLVVETNEMRIPHYDLIKRDFVLVPMLDLNQEIIHPENKKKLKIFLSQLKDKYIIDKINLNMIDENSEDHP